MTAAAAGVAARAVGTVGFAIAGLIVVVGVIDFVRTVLIVASLIDLLRVADRPRRFIDVVALIVPILDVEQALEIGCLVLVGPDKLRREEDVTDTVGGPDLRVRERRRRRQGKDRKAADEERADPSRSDRRFRYLINS